MRTSETKTPKSPEQKRPTRPMVLKVKPAGAEKWKVLGYLNVREDLSGGVATLIAADGSRIEKVAIFPNDKKPTAAEPAPVED